MSDLKLQTTEEQRAELARAVVDSHGDLLANVTTVLNVLADHATLEAECQRLRERQCKGRDKCSLCAEQFSEGNSWGRANAEDDMELPAIAAWFDRNARRDDTCLGDGYRRLAEECQSLLEQGALSATNTLPHIIKERDALRERAEVAELAVRSMARETVDEDGLGDDGREDRFQYVLDCAYHDAIEKYQARAALDLPALYPPDAAAEARNVLEQARLDGIIDRWRLDSPEASGYGWGAAVWGHGNSVEKWFLCGDRNGFPTEAEALTAAAAWVEEQRKPVAPEVEEMAAWQIARDMRGLRYECSICELDLTLRWWHSGVSPRGWIQSAGESPLDFHRRALREARKQAAQ